MPKKIPGAVNQLSRIGKDWFSEIKYIQEERLKRGVDVKKTSFRRLSNLSVKHKLWPKIKEEMIEVNLEEINKDD